MSVGSVLFVDDDPFILKSLRRELASCGFRCFFSDCAAEGLRIIENERISVVVADGFMPMMTGIELLTLLKRTHPSIVRVLLTGHGDADMADQAVTEAGAFRVMQKPWDHDALIATLTTCLTLPPQPLPTPAEALSPTDEETLLTPPAIS